MHVDVAIIGAGVVGCAMARRFALSGLRVILLERGYDILSGASKANSAILHTGFDAPAGSLELACMQAGYSEYMEIRSEMNLPLLQTGGIVVAWTEEEERRLSGIRDQAIANGVADVALLDRGALHRMEPALSSQAIAGLHVPGEHVIDPWSPFLGYVIQAMRHSAAVFFQTEVLRGSFDGEQWRLETTQGSFQARHVINCAGLYGDIVNERVLGQSDYIIKPRKGQFVVFDKSAARLLTAIILPVPSESTKGVVLTRTIFGNLLVGPTAEEQDDRSRAAVEMKQMRGLIDRAIQILPQLKDVPVTAVYAGLRPASERKEYRIHFDRERHWIAVGGIRSTGLTGALGIARHVLGLYEDADSVKRPVIRATPCPMPNLAEHLPRDWQTEGYGEIVCHCEMVTRREIEAALSGPLPPGDFGGLKRRTRCGMGQCQGFNCNARLAALAGSVLKVPLDMPDIGSNAA